MTDDPRFYAWLDGELAPDEALKMGRRVAADPALQALAERQRALKRMLSAAFGAVSSAPLPQRLEEAARPTAEVVDLAAARDRRRWSWAKQAAAMAASVALGLFAGATLLAPEGLVRSDGGQLVAGGGLDRALSTQLASAEQFGDTRVALTFRANDGSYCRSFTSDGSAGLACREGDRWRIRGLFSGGEGQAADYRMAAGQDPRLLELIDSTIEGEPLGPKAEAELARRDWKN